MRRVNKIVQFFKIDHWSVAPIFLGESQNVAQKLVWIGVTLIMAPFSRIWFISSSTSSFFSRVIFLPLVKKFDKGVLWKEFDIHELC